MTLWGTSYELAATATSSYDAPGPVSDLVEIVQVVLGGFPAERGGVGAELLAAGHARDDRGDRRLGGESGDGDVEDREAALGGVRLQRLDAVPVGCGQPTGAAGVEVRSG